MDITYTVKVDAQSIFVMAYSYVQLRATYPGDGTAVAQYASIPVSVANDEHIQRVFVRNQPSNPKDDTIIDIFFPRLAGLNTLDVMIYPAGTNPTAIDENTPGFLYSVDLTTYPQLEGSTLLLGLEDKEKNVRVLPIDDTISPPALSPSYTWTATILPDATAKVSGAIAHVTELFDTNFIKNNSFTAATANNLVKTFDPSRSKYHLYFRSGTDGSATLSIAIPQTPSWGHLIYWPFADNASEVARIVFYNQNRFGPNLFGPDPQKNPITLSDYSDTSGPIFNIRNAQDPKAIKAGPDNSIYFLINDRYEKTLPSQSADIFETMTSTKLIIGSAGSLPQSNTARIVYVENNGNVSSSPKYSFFAFRGKAQ
jgi:hypothetical protein